MTGARLAGVRRPSLALVFGFGLALLAAGCGHAPSKPDPTDAEWKHATDAPAAAKAEPAPQVGAPRLGAPADDATVTSADLEAAQGAIVFSWSWVGAPVVLELASDRNFTAIVREARADGNGLALRLDAGSYFWRVRVLGQGGATSNVHSLKVEAARPEATLSPQ